MEKGENGGNSRRIYDLNSLPWNRPESSWGRSSVLRPAEAIFPRDFRETANPPAISQEVADKPPPRLSLVLSTNWPPLCARSPIRYCRFANARIPGLKILPFFLINRLTRGKKKEREKTSESSMGNRSTIGQKQRRFKSFLGLRVMASL